MKRFLYGSVWADEYVQSIFDLLGFIANPHDEKRAASHITLQGPYQEEKTVFETFDGKQAMLDGIELFETNKGKAVVFLLKIDDIKNVWDKPDFPNGKAHVTIFEGRKYFAQKLFDELNYLPHDKPAFEISPIKQINHKFMLTREFPNFQHIKKIFETITREEWEGYPYFKSLSDTRRISIILKIFNYLIPSHNKMKKTTRYKKMFFLEKHFLRKEKLPENEQGLALFEVTEQK